MERHGVILLLELKLLPAPPAACSGALQGGSFLWAFFLFLHLLFPLWCFSKWVQKETKVWNNTATMQQVCVFLGATSTRLWNDNRQEVRLSRCNKQDNPADLLHHNNQSCIQMASLCDYKIRESMNAFRFYTVSECIFPKTLKHFITAEI